MILGQCAYVIRRAVAVVNIQRINLVLLVHTSVQVYRSIEIFVARDRLVEFASLDNGYITDRSDIDRSGKLGSLAVDDDQSAALGHSCKGHDSVDIDVIRQFFGNICQ